MAATIALGVWDFPETKIFHRNANRSNKICGSGSYALAIFHLPHTTPGSNDKWQF
jgi:hypothetical protein